LAEAEAALKKEEEQGQQAERQLGQMVEAQRRLGQELQEGVEAREDAQAQRDQAQVPLLQLDLLTLIFFCCCLCFSAGFTTMLIIGCISLLLHSFLCTCVVAALHYPLCTILAVWAVTEHKINTRKSNQPVHYKAVVQSSFLAFRPSRQTCIAFLKSCNLYYFMCL